MTQRLEAQGNQGGQNKWDDGSDNDDVRKIYVRGDSQGIQHIQVDYIENGQLKYGPVHGLTEQGFTLTFKMNYLKDEQLESVEGYYDPTLKMIIGLQFKTNLRFSELIGYAKKGTKFSLAVDGKKIVGFHGSVSPKLDSLGAYFTWITPTRSEAKGGKGGQKWDDGAGHEAVTKIYVRGHCGGIQFIRFDYVKDGQHVYGSEHGHGGKGFTETFEINHIEKEYLVSVEGYYDDNESGVIQGLQFKTNIKTSMLLGDDKGKKFTLAANGKKINGFHGYAEKNLISLGAYFTTSSSTKTKPVGSSDLGEVWDDGPFTGLKRVYTRHDLGRLRYVKFDYDNVGKVISLGHGDFRGAEGEFEVDYPNELFISVEGTISTGDRMTWISSLTFKTSKGRTSPTFGIVDGYNFILESKGCALVGFHGRSYGGAIWAIGAYFCPLPPAVDSEKLEAKGGNEGFSWDDGGFDGIRNIYIGRSESGIAFVKFVYDKDNQAVVGDDHGIKTLLEVDEFELECPSEYLTSVEGYYDVVDGSDSEVIRMLKFKTNMRPFQVFGTETDSNFTLEKDCHKIVGFHGKSSKMLNQIGVHVLPITE